MKKVAFLLILILSLSVFSLAHAGFDDGKAAYDRGDYATAFKEFKSLAAQEDARAQNGLGVVYQLGKGVPRDHVEVVKWYRKAAGRPGRCQGSMAV